VTARLDRAGQGVLVAMAMSESVAMNDDVKLREMSSDPRGSRVLVSDPGTALGLSLLRELAAAGARRVWPGTPVGQKQSAGTGVLVEPGEVARQDTSAAHAMPVVLDIVINNPGGGGPEASAREQMESNYFGLLRLWEELGPAVLAPRNDWPGTRAWVNVLSLDALCNLPSQSTFSASMAAAHSFSQGMRARARSTGVRVVNVFAAPMSPESLARAVVRALVDGLEDVYPGEVAQEFLARWLQSPAALQREVGGHV
jgi:NAD(P)-dependent dehydrogenase (short-subunit alcohol dehydrogenase family)